MYSSNMNEQCIPMYSKNLPHRPRTTQCFVAWEAETTEFVKTDIGCAKKLVKGQQGSPFL
jgi:hypothetical protein